MLEAEALCALGRADDRPGVAGGLDQLEPGAAAFGERAADNGGFGIQGGQVRHVAAVVDPRRCGGAGRQAFIAGPGDDQAGLGPLRQDQWPDALHKAFGGRSVGRVTVGAEEQHRGIGGRAGRVGWHGDGVGDGHNRPGKAEPPQVGCVGRTAHRCAGGPLGGATFFPEQGGPFGPGQGIAQTWPLTRQGGTLYFVHNVVQVEQDGRVRGTATKRDHWLQPVDDNEIRVSVEPGLQCAQQVWTGIAVIGVLPRQVGQAAYVVVQERGGALMPGQGAGVDVHAPEGRLLCAVGAADGCRDMQHLDPPEAGAQGL